MVKGFFLSTIGTGQINPEESTLNDFETAINVSMYGICLGSDNKLYVGPHNRREIIIVDVDDNVSRVDISSLSTSSRWGCGIVDHGDYVYVAPHNVSRFARMHKSTFSLSFVGATVGGGNFKFFDVVKNTIDNCFYCVPVNALRILKHDPLTETGSLIGPTFASTDFNRGIFMPNGKIYFSPNQAQQFYEFDPVTETGSFFGTNYGATNDKFGRMERIDNNRFIASARGVQQYCIVDTNTMTTTLWGTIKTRAIGGICKLGNGKFYTMPNQNPLGSWEIDLNKSDDTFVTWSTGTFVNGAVRRGRNTMYGAPNSNNVSGVQKFSI